MLVLRQNNDESDVMPNCKEIELAQIKTDTKTQSRAGIDPVIVNEYAQAMQAGCRFPALVVFFDGVNWWLADGYHRLAAAQQNATLTIQVEIKHGDLRDAILYSCGANEEHGIRRTNQDRRRAVIRFLAFSNEECLRWSNCKVATVCKVTESFVRKLKNELSSHSAKIDTEKAKKCGVDLTTLLEAQKNIPPQSDELAARRTVHRAGNTFEMNTAQIGAKQRLQSVASSSQLDSPLVVQLPEAPMEEFASLEEDNVEPDQSLTPPAPKHEIIAETPKHETKGNSVVTSATTEGGELTAETDVKLPDEIAKENSKLSNGIELVLATIERIEELNIKGEILLKGNRTPITGQVERVFVNWQAEDGQQGGSWFPLKLLNIVSIKKAG